jgi:SAM-dependent methyltransferase
MLRGWAGHFRVWRELLEFRRLGGARRLPVRWRDRFTCAEDATATTDFDRHYIYHPAWAARLLARTLPEEHVDVGSTLAFCTVVSAFVPTRFYDYRPASLHLPGLATSHADLTRLPFPDASIRSLSCMHVVEHVGLGRYGDQLDPDGDLKAIAELTRVLAPGGNLLFVVPVGTPRIQFNAHRIYSPALVRRYFDALELREFALIPDRPSDGDLVVDPPAGLVERQRYGCGCFWFSRL